MGHVFCVCSVHFQPHLVTAKAKKIAHFYPEERDIETRKKFPELNSRLWDFNRLRFDRGRKEYVIEVRGLDALLIGRNSVDTRYLEQLAEPGQLETCGWVLKAFKQSTNRSGVDEICNLLNKIQNEGFGSLVSYNNGLLALPRVQEVWAVINRIR